MAAPDGKSVPSATPSADAVSAGRPIPAGPGTEAADLSMAHGVADTASDPSAAAAAGRSPERRPPAGQSTGCRPNARLLRDWSEIRRAYEETDLKVPAIAAMFGIRPEVIYRKASRAGWSSRRGSGRRPGDLPPVDRTALVRRLFLAVEKQIVEIERRFGDGSGAIPDEKDARTLAALARTLELLIGLQTTVEPVAAEPEVDIDEFRLDLARRIEGLRRSE